MLRRAVREGETVDQRGSSSDRRPLPVVTSTLRVLWRSSPRDCEKARDRRSTCAQSPTTSKSLGGVLVIAGCG
jgi:hypothetical protein